MPCGRQRGILIKNVTLHTKLDSHQWRQSWTNFKMREVQWISVVDPDRFWATLIRILPLSSKKIKKNLDFYCYLLLCVLEDWYNVPLKGNKQKNLFFDNILKSTDKMSRIRIRRSLVRIRIHHTTMKSMKQGHQAVKGLTFENTIKPCRAKLTLQKQNTWHSKLDTT